MARIPLILCALAGLGLAGFSAVAATVFTVGDSAGWDISADLASWAATKIFYVGDTLLFQYSRYHSVSEVDRGGYDACNNTSFLLSGTGGNTTVPLTAPGDRFFVCGAQLHCLGGMKVHVNVQVNQSSRVAPAEAPQAHTEAPSPFLRWNGGTGDFPIASGGGGGHGVAATARAACGLVAWSVCALWVFDQLLN